MRRIDKLIGASVIPIVGLIALSFDSYILMLVVGSFHKGALSFLQSVGIIFLAGIAGNRVFRQVSPQ